MIKTDTHLYFYGGPAIYSNFWPCKFTNGLVDFTTTEQAFMYHKALMMGDNTTASKILNTAHPKDCKQLGREIKNYDDELWSEIRFGVMVYVNALKFSQNPDFSKELMETGDRILVEASPYDKIWGIGLGLNNPDVYDESKWQGQNLLGKALILVREELKKRRRNYNSRKFMNVDIQKIKNTFVRQKSKVIIKVYFDGEQIATADGKSSWETKDHAEQSLLNHFMINSHLIGIDSTTAYALLRKLEQDSVIKYLSVYLYN